MPNRIFVLKLRQCEAPFKIRFPWSLEFPEGPSKTTRLIGWVRKAAPNGCGFFCATFELSN
jgi:hypothetical protein